MNMLLAFIFSVAAAGALGFELGARWQRRRQAGQIQRMLDELKASADALERAVKQNPTVGKEQ